MKFLPLIILTLFLSSCSLFKISAEYCQQSDWESIGQTDASEYYTNRFDYYLSSCAEYGITPDKTKYQSGFSKGVKDLCTFQNGYLIGNEGKNLPKICPIETQETFVKGFIEGQKNHDQKVQLEKQNQLMEKALQLKEAEGKQTRSCGYDSDCTVARKCLNYRCEVSGKSCVYDSNCSIEGRCERNQCRY